MYIYPRFGPPLVLALLIPLYSAVAATSSSSTDSGLPCSFCRPLVLALLISLYSAVPATAEGAPWSSHRPITRTGQHFGFLFSCRFVWGSYKRSERYIRTYEHTFDFDTFLRTTHVLFLKKRNLSGRKNAMLPVFCSTTLFFFCATPFFSYATVLFSRMPPFCFSYATDLFPYATAATVFFACELFVRAALTFLFSHVNPFYHAIVFFQHVPRFFSSCHRFFICATPFPAPPYFECTRAYLQDGALRYDVRHYHQPQRRSHPCF